MAPRHEACPGPCPIGVGAEMTGGQVLAARKAYAADLFAFSGAEVSARCPEEAAPRAITQRLWFPALFSERSRACSSRESRTDLRRNHISPILLFGHTNANLCTEETGLSSREYGPLEAARQGRFRGRDNPAPLSRRGENDRSRTSPEDCPSIRRSLASSLDQCSSTA